MKKNKIKNTEQRFKFVEPLQGESIEQKVARILQSNEPITDGAPIIYTEKKDGVLPAYNIRTDRLDIAIDVKDKIEMARTAEKKTTAKPEDFKAVPDKTADGQPSDN